MGDTSRLNKPLWTNITRLKLLTKLDAPVKFILEQSPFNEEEEENVPKIQDKYVIIGLIFPNSDIYKESAFRIEMILTTNYPREPPVVRFLTSMYHPNIETNGEFCHQLLSSASKWRNGTTLVEVVKAIVKHIDEPDLLYVANFDIAKEYVENKLEFKRKALDAVKKNLIPRT